MEKQSTQPELGSKVKNYFNKLRNVNAKEVMGKLRENAAMIVGTLILIVITIFFFIAYFRTKNLERNKCKEFKGVYGDLNGSLSSINQNKVSKEASNNFAYFLNEYYIKTAYNACSLGDYKNSAVSLCMLKDILKQGVRALDFEIYSIDDKPVVATSIEESFYVKETFNYVYFEDVLTSLREFAFSSTGSPNPDDPIIIHLRIKSTNNRMFTNLATLFESMGNYILGKEYSFENDGKNLGREQLLKFKKKIILMIDKSNSAFLANEKLKEFVNMTSNSVFMRALRFTQGVKYTPDMDELKGYNKRNFTIALPDPGNDPENPNSLLARSMGCQMVAMRYQLADGPLKEDTDFFNRHGHAFVLKPRDLRYIPTFIKEPKRPDPKLSYKPRNLDAPDGLYDFKI